MSGGEWERPDHIRSMAQGLWIVRQMEVAGHLSEEQGTKRRGRIFGKARRMRALRATEVRLRTANKAGVSPEELYARIREG